MKKSRSSRTSGFGQTVLRSLRGWEQSVPLLKRLSSIADRIFQDGLDTSPYVERLSHEFTVAFHPDELSRLRTLQALTDLIARSCTQNGIPMDQQDIWNRVRRITSEEFGVDQQELHPDIRFKEDLNCD